VSILVSEDHFFVVVTVVGDTDWSLVVVMGGSDDVGVGWGLLVVRCSDDVGVAMGTGVAGSNDVRVSVGNDVRVAVGYDLGVSVRGAVGWSSGSVIHDH